MKKKVENINLEYEDSSGNVFADLGLSNPEERLAKAELAIQIRRIITQMKLTQKEAAELLEIDQPKISLLISGKLTGFSLERLFRFLNKLGQNITITIEKRDASSQKRPNLIVAFSNHSADNIPKHR